MARLNATDGSLRVWSSSNWHALLSENGHTVSVKYCWTEAHLLENGNWSPKTIRKNAKKEKYNDDTRHPLMVWDYMVEMLNGPGWIGTEPSKPETGL